jgi:UDPglucose 6-dehydrogenase
VTHPAATAARSALDAAKGADAVLVMTPWPQFRKLDLAQIAATMAGRLLVDPYGVFAPQAAAAAGLRHFTLGRSE